MLRFLKWLAIALVLLIVIGVGTAWALSARKLAAKHEVPDHPPAAPSPDSVMLARGEHLAHATAVCADCHGQDLGGRFIAEMGPIGVLAAPNLTPGQGSVTANFTDADWERAIRHGVRPDGRSLIIMPAEAFTYMSDEDFAALLAYLKRLQPVDREIVPTHLKPLGRALLAFDRLPVLVAPIVPKVEHPGSVPTEPVEEYGAYLTRIGGCTTCHGAALAGAPGNGPEGKPASNLTKGGIGKAYTEADFVRALRTGHRPDGTQLDSTAMPWKTLGHMTDAELHAIWARLQSVPGKEFGEN